MTTLGCLKFIAALSGAGVALFVHAAGPTGAKARVNCETIPAGPARTDCYIGLGRISRQKSEIAASTVQQQTDTAIYHQFTGKRPKTKRHRATSDQ
jgi:hypothetical protein